MQEHRTAELQRHCEEGHRSIAKWLQTPEFASDTQLCQQCRAVDADIQAALTRVPVQLRGATATAPGQGVQLAPSMASAMDLGGAHVTSDGHELISQLLSDGHELISQLLSDGHELVTQLLSDGHELISQLLSDGHELSPRLTLCIAGGGAGVPFSDIGLL